MTFLFPTPATVGVAVDGSDALFPVRRVYCVGRNYAAHAREMGMDERDPPFFFTKFADTVVPSGSVLAYPPRTSDFHYEGELVIAIGEAGRDVPVERAEELIFGYACGLDMTRRDLQFAARDKGRPWDMGKNFSQAAVVGTIGRRAGLEPLAGRMLRLTRNDRVMQEADLALMMWSCAEIVSDLSRYDALAPGDLIFTGTPAGVGPVERGERLEVTIDGLPPLRVSIA